MRGGENSHRVATENVGYIARDIHENLKGLAAGLRPPSCASGCHFRRASSHCCRSRSHRRRAARQSVRLRTTTASPSRRTDVHVSLLDELREQAQARGNVGRRELQRFADEMFDTRDARVGAMPFEFASFIAQYTSPELPPSFVDG